MVSNYSAIHYSWLGGSFFYEGRYFNSLEEINTSFGGGLVVCERVDGDREGRLRLHKIYAQSVEEYKNGWYDFYTYTRKADSIQQKGFYLCRILEFKKDKNGFLNMVVEALVFLGEKITEVPEELSERLARALCWFDKEADMPAWDYLRGEMSPIAFQGAMHPLGTFNFLKACEQFPIKEAMQRLLAGEVAILQDISKALREPTDIEKATAFIQEKCWASDFEEKYPLLAKKARDMKRSELGELLERKLEEFKTKELKLPAPTISDQEDLLSKVEATLEYWRDFNNAKKAADKAAKKAAKAAKKAATQD